jgi:hypothetical protein
MITSADHVVVALLSVLEMYEIDASTLDEA